MMIIIIINILNVSTQLARGSNSTHISFLYKPTAFYEIDQIVFTLLTFGPFVQGFLTSLSFVWDQYSNLTFFHNFSLFNMSARISATGC